MALLYRESLNVYDICKYKSKSILVLNIEIRLRLRAQFTHLSFRINDLSHAMHLYGSSPSCVRMCNFSVPVKMKIA